MATKKANVQSVLDLVFKGKRLGDMTGAEVRVLAKEQRALADQTEALAKALTDLAVLPDTKANSFRILQAHDLLRAAGYREDAKGNWRPPRR